MRDDRGTPLRVRYAPETDYFQLHGLRAALLPPHLIVLGIVGLVLAVALFIALRNSPLTVLVQLAGFAAIAIATATARRGEAVRYARSRRRCPACMRKLELEATEDDGCTPCRSCDAWWRFPPSELTHRERTAHLGRLKDDRGRTVRRQPQRPVPRALRRTRTIKELDHAEQLILVATGLAVIAFGAVNTPLAWLGRLVAFATGLVLFWWASKPGVYSALALNDRRCLACLYDLSATSPDDDGRTTCPECASAWRLPSAPDPSDSGDA